MQGYTTLGHAVDVLLGEMPVHVGIDEAEDNSLVAHQCLVVTLTVGNGLLVGTTVLHLPENAAGFPVLVGLFLNSLDPIVGYVHGHAVVEAEATVLKLGSKSGHTGNFLCDGDGIGILLMDEFVGQRKIADGIVVLMSVEVVTIAAEGFTQSVAVVEHGGDAVEAESVEMELSEPVTTIGKQEVNHLILTIVETERIPSRIQSESQAGCSWRSPG